MSESLLSSYPNDSTSSLPSGIICMWSGASNNIPTGWALCNGQNGTPNLVDRFIVGAGSGYAVGATGGEATHRLTSSEMPSHTHTFSGGSHTHSVSGNTGSASLTYCNADLNGGTAVAVKPANYSTGYPHGTLSIPVSLSVSLTSATISGSITSTGGNTAHENRPPYYALCFIMKL